MTEQRSRASKKNQWTVIIAVAIVAVISAIFFIEFAIASVTPPVDDADSVAQGYADVLAELPEGDAERGMTLVTTTFECHVCHVAAAGQQAPAFNDYLTREDALNDLSHEAYLYESILYPSRYVVEGYVNAMPQNYRDRIDDQQLADMIAYLLAQ